MKQFKAGAGRFCIFANFWMVFLFSVIFGSFATASDIDVKARKTEIYTVYNVKVDEKSNSAENAQRKALISGRRAALMTLFKKILVKDDVGKVPYLSNNQIEELLTGFSVSHEKRSNVRYMANLSFYFDKDKIHDIFALLQISSAELYADPISILPILKENGEYFIWGETNIWRSKWQGYDYVNELITLDVFPYHIEYESALSPDLMLQRDLREVPEYTWEKAIEDQKYDMRSYEVFSKKYFTAHSPDVFYVTQVNLQRLGSLEDMKLGLTIYKIQKDNDGGSAKPVLHKYYGLNVDRDGKSFVVSEKIHLKIINDSFLKFDDEYYKEKTIVDVPSTPENIEEREAEDLMNFEERLIQEEQVTIPDVSLLSPSSLKEDIYYKNEHFVQAADQLFEEAQKDIINYFAGKWKEKNLVDFTDIKQINVVIHLENSKTWFLVSKKLNKLTLMNSVKLINLNIKKANISFKYAGNFKQLQFDMEKHNLKFERLLTEEQIFDYHNQIKTLEENRVSVYATENIEHQDIKKPTGLGAWSISLIK